MDKPLQKALSLRQAQRCEDACEPKCVCRCGGAAHGRKGGAGLGFFTGLPDGDPHHIDSKEQKAAKKKAAREAKWRKQLDTLMNL